MVFIGRLCEAKTVHVIGKGRLSAAEDKRFPGKGLSRRLGRESSVHRIKLRQIKRIPYVPSSWNGGKVCARRRVKVLQLLE
jgi:hypothetical protein